MGFGSALGETLVALLGVPLLTALFFGYLGQMAILVPVRFVVRMGRGGGAPGARGALESLLAGGPARWVWFLLTAPVVFLLLAAVLGGLWSDVLILGGALLGAAAYVRTGLAVWRRAWADPG